MIRIITYEGILLSCEDSKQFIEFNLRGEFNNFSEFLKCKEVKFSNYWGDVYLLGVEEDYYKWITQIAERILKT